jgi:hypothetical protein
MSEYDTRYHYFDESKRRDTARAPVQCFGGC